MKPMFGHCKRECFYLSPGFTNLNHGSFGTVPRAVKSVQDSYFEQAEAFPDKWFTRDMFPLMDVSRKEISSMIHSQRIDDVVLVENASAAVNSVLRGLASSTSTTNATATLQAGDAVLVLSTAYNMVKEVLDWMISTKNIRVVIAKIEFPLGDKDEVINVVRETFAQNHGIKLCVFSHITSIPAFILPVKKLSKLCKSKPNKQSVDPLIFIDGAHAPGSIDIFVEDLGADFYTGNLHKWCFAPKGCAFLWTKPQHQEFKTLPPPVISSSGLHDYISRFAYTGTKDYTAFATIPAAFDFCRAQLGGWHVVNQYNHELVIYGASLCADRWGTSLIITSNDMLATMADVILPAQSEDEVKALVRELENKHQIGIKTDSLILKDNSKVWICRLSGQIYLEKIDFQRLADIVWRLRCEK